jgi:hypothetical protein
MKRTPVTAAVLALVAAVSVRADNAAVCEQPHDVDQYQLLRRLSLDIRGRIPSIEEYEALDKGAAPFDHVADWVKTDEFRLAMRKYHENMLWPNVSAARLTSISSQLSIKSGEPALHLTSTGREKTWRGANDTICGDFQETRFLPEADPGNPVYKVDVSQLQPDASGVRQDGWRLVAPYWDPANPVKVCAFDAQATPTVTKANKTLQCGNPSAHGDPSCGCGADLHWCYGPANVTSQAILSDMREQLDRAVDAVTTGGAPYTDLLLNTTAWENGRLAFFKRWLSTNVNISGTVDFPDLTETIPDKPFTDTTWTQIDRGPDHAGVTTLPAYLLRFQTNRGRANRFRINFLCEQFVPPDTLSDTQGCVNQGTDLQQRCNCRYCHATVEPMAAHWATFSEAGTTLQKGNPLFPTKNPSCVSANPSAFCSRFYVTQSDAHNAGSMLAYQYADLYPTVQSHIDGGPRLLARTTIDAGDFASCAVKRLFLQFIGREMHVAGSTSEELGLMTQLAAGFKTAQYSFPWLVQQVVSLPQYKRAR